MPLPDTDEQLPENSDENSSLTSEMANGCEFVALNV